MQITIFGATTQVGKQLVKDGIALGHTIIAYGRNVYTANFPDNKKLILKNGALFDEVAVRHALQNSDAVLAALEGSTDGTDYTRSLGMKNIVTQMKKANVNRIVNIGGPGILDGPDEQMRMYDEDFPEEDVPVSAEQLKALQWMETSGVTWTMIAANAVVDGDPTGDYFTEINRLPDMGSENVSTGNLALCCFRAIMENIFENTRVGIADA